MKKKKQPRLTFDYFVEYTAYNEFWIIRPGYEVVNSKPQWSAPTSDRSLLQTRYVDDSLECKKQQKKNSPLCQPLLNLSHMLKFRAVRLMPSVKTFTQEHSISSPTLP